MVIAGSWARSPAPSGTTMEWIRRRDCACCAGLRLGGTSQSSIRETSVGEPIKATVKGASLSRSTVSGLSPAIAELACFQKPRPIMLTYSRFSMKTEWVTFDCYGTLIDWDGGIRRFFGSLPGITDAEAMLVEWEEIQ